jgi:hypothetical protein
VYDKLGSTRAFAFDARLGHQEEEIWLTKAIT